MSQTHITELCLPRLGETMEQGRVTRWIVAEGQPYARGEILLEVETDKTIVEVPALMAGRLVEILVNEDDSVTIDAPIARIELEGAAEEDTANTGGGARFVSPRARRLARRQGIDAESLRGSGRHGRVQAADVLAVSGSGSLALAAAKDRAGRLADSRGAQVADVDYAVRDQVVKLAAGSLFCRFWEPDSETDSRAPLAVLVHGLFGDVDNWVETGAALARRGNSAMAMDLPGHGKSGMGEATFEAQVSALQNLIEQNADRPLVLIGHSLGGALATELAVRLGDSVQALVLIAPIGLGSRMDQGFIDGLSLGASPVVLRRELARLTVKGLLPGGEYLSGLEQRLRANQPGLRALCAEVAIHGVQRLDIRPALASLSCPVSMIWGREDAIVDWADALNAPAGTALYPLAQVGHMPMWEASGAVQSILQRSIIAAGR